MVRKTKFVPIQGFIDKNTHCKNGPRCDTPNCPFLHKFKTRMCKFEDKCRRRDNCSFAHTKDELYIPLCRFGEKCKKEGCTFKHPQQPTIKESPKPENKIENLSKKNFPQMVKVELSDIDVIKYQDMKNIVKYVPHVIVKKESIEEMIEEMECVKKFDKITFEF